MLSNVVNRSAKDLFQYYYYFRFIKINMYVQVVEAPKVIYIRFSIIKIQSKAIMLFDPHTRMRWNLISLLFLQLPKEKKKRFEIKIVRFSWQPIS